MKIVVDRNMALKAFCDQHNFKYIEYTPVNHSRYGTGIIMPYDDITFDFERKGKDERKLRNKR